MRKKIIAGNWKMNHLMESACEFVEKLRIQDISYNKADILICPPFVFLSKIADLLVGSNIKLGAQNAHFEEKGAFTGEISVQMLKSVGCDYVIIGHSERRHIFKEDNEMINKKVLKVAEADLIPIFCLGETLEERESGKLFSIVEDQLKFGLKNLEITNADKLVIAYEPVWAIGTGVNATPDQAEEMHDFLRNKILSEIFGKDFASGIRILYGGSVKPDNSGILLSQNNIDGALIGGASLKVEMFYDIIKSVE